MREKVLTFLFNIVCTIFFGLLFFYSLTMTGYVPFDLSTELISFRQDNILLNCLWLGVTMILLYGIYVLVKKYEHRLNTRVIAVGVALCAMAISMYWVAGANVRPESDQWNVGYYANVFNLGDFSGFEKGKYIAMCPHQLGIVTLLRIVYGIFGPDRFAAFRMISVIGVGFIVYAGYEIVRKLTKNNCFAEIVYFLLAVLCFPLHIYTLFIYGEVSSTAFLFIAAWVLLSCLEHFHWGKVIGLLLCAGISVQLRQNSLIVLLGFLIVLIVKVIQKVHWKTFVMIAAIPAGILAGNLIIDCIYHEYYQEDADAIPSIMYVAMGTNWKEENPGWFSAYNYDVFFENDCDSEVCTQIAMADLMEFVEYCADHPDYALEFYKAKFLAQWNDPMYHSLVMNSNFNIGEGRSPMMESFYFGNLRIFTEAFMNIYQLLVYGAILFWLVMNFKQKQGIEMHILLIGIFGGFLFSLIWEAKTRYIFPYFVMMLPYAALGIERLISMLHGFLVGLRSGKI